MRYRFLAAVGVLLVLAGFCWWFLAFRNGTITICEVATHICGDVPAKDITGGPQGDYYAHNCVGIKGDDRYFCRPDYKIYDMRTTLPRLKYDCLQYRGTLVRTDDHMYTCGVHTFDLLVGVWMSS